MIKLTTIKKYKAKGIILGETWGGRIVGFPSREIENKTMEGLIKEAEKQVKTGELDSGMGFKYLKGALLDIEEIETIVYKGEKYKRSEYDIEFVGNLTNKEKDFLIEAFF